MATQVQRRYARLLGEGFPAWEARKIAAAREFRLADPALKVLRRERRVAWKETRKAGLGKRSLNRQIAFQYRAEGLVDDKGRFRPVQRLSEIREIPRVARQVRMVRVQRETAAGMEGRYSILRRAGFFPWEARLLATMKDISPDQRRHTFLSAPWQAMIKNHRAFVERMTAKAGNRLRKEMGETRWNRMTAAQKLRLSQEKLNDMLRRLYATGRYNPYDWLRREYRPTRAPRAYQTEQRKRSKKRTDKRLATQKQTVMFFD